MPANPATIAAWLGAGRLALRNATEPLRLWATFRDGRANDTQRRRAVLRLIAITGAKLVDGAAGLANRFASGLATIGGWARDALDIIAGGHFGGMMAARGTIDPSPADIDVAAGEVDRQSGYLDRFAGQVSAGMFPIWEPKKARPTIRDRVTGFFVRPAAPVIQPVAQAGEPEPRKPARRFLARIAMYADAIWGTAEKVVRAGMVREGFTYARWMLGGSEHHCEGCPRQAAMGWRPINDVPPIGSQECLTRCRCWLIFSHDMAGSPTASPMAMAV